MKQIEGTYGSAKVFTSEAYGLDAYAEAQIKLLCDNEASRGATIRVMPDVHPGKVGPIGLTMTVGERVLPNLVGIDIGCGILAAKIKQNRVEVQQLDGVIRKQIPAGFSLRKKPHRFAGQFDFQNLHCGSSIREEKAVCSLGTLGGGNHFIEVDRDDAGAYYVVIHSGSRHLGKEVTEYYLRNGQKALAEQGIQAPYELIWLEGDLMEQYLEDLQVIQSFAAKNREAMLDEITKGMKWRVEEVFSCIHNYVEQTGTVRILRKGAISAKAGETVLIPIHMRDGVLMGRGKGNPDWNQSAPHGAGRILKREDVKAQYTVSQYKKAMAGIYCSCIGPDTLDEAPFSYRSMDAIREAIGDTVTIEAVLHPVYNYKAGGKA